MKLLKESFEILVGENYFDTNFNIMLKLNNIKNQRLIESFLCSKEHYKTFLKNYIRLQEDAKLSNDFRCDLLDALKQLVTNNVCVDGRLALSSYRVLAVLFFNLFLEEDCFNVGYFRFKSPLTELIQVLQKQDLSISSTLEKACELCHIRTTTVMGKMKIDYVTFLSIINNSLLGLAYPETLAEEEHYKIDFNSNARIFVKAHEDIVRSSLTRRNMQVINRSTVSHMDEIHEFEPIERKGFLKREKCSGRLNLSRGVNIPASALMESNLQTVDINYYIKEVVTKQGVVIFYNLYNDDFKISIIEDYITNKVITNLLFVDFESQLNTNETMTGIVFWYYTEVREEYIKTLNNKENLTNKVRVYQPTANKHTIDSRNYIYELISIAPYVRKIPSGDWASPERIEEAKRYNITLQKGETFVNGFEREQRYLPKKDIF